AMAKSLSLPFIVHGRSFGIDLDYPFLDVDNEGAFFDATRFLLQLGHKRIALLNGQADLDFAHRRRLGTERALAEKGLLLDPRHTRHSFMGDEQGYRGMKEILSGPDRPTAVLCASTVLALGAVRAMNELGLKLGVDISLIAHDDELPLLKPENFSTPLTTTRSSLRAAGKRIGDRLIAMINQTEPAPPEQELWKVELVVRASTGPAPA
ncbi:MAG: substrate-binding domain-containing protein, partial [Allorhizobium sp.]